MGEELSFILAFDLPPLQATYKMGLQLRATHYPTKLNSHAEPLQKTLQLSPARRSQVSSNPVSPH